MTGEAEFREEGQAKARPAIAPFYISARLADAIPGLEPVVAPIIAPFCIRARLEPRQSARGRRGLQPLCRKQGLKPGSFGWLTARLKSRPDTNAKEPPTHGDATRLSARLKSCPDTRHTAGCDRRLCGWLLHDRQPGPGARRATGVSRFESGPANHTESRHPPSPNLLASLRVRVARPAAIGAEL